MFSLNYENINYVMTQILKLSCAKFSYVNISYVLAFIFSIANWPKTSKNLNFCSIEIAHCGTYVQ